MGSEEQAAPFFARYGLADAARVSDPGLVGYRAFGLGRMGAGELVSPANWLRSVTAVVGHGTGVPIGDMRQMPGVFLVHAGRIVASHRHGLVSERPDYAALSQPDGRAPDGGQG